MNLFEMEETILVADTATYMNVDTGSTGGYFDWSYQDENGNWCNAVDKGEVVRVVCDGDGWWVEA